MKLGPVLISILSLVLTSSVSLQVVTIVPTIQGEAIAMETITLRPGENRVTFQSEGETLVGTLFLPVTYQPSDKLPAVVVAHHG
jgi:poly(3-hydroxybutyrate) depolymerase